MTAAENKRAQINLTLQGPTKLKHIREWLALADAEGYNDESTVTVSFGDLIVGRWARQ